MSNDENFIARQYFVEKYGVCPYCATEPGRVCGLHKEKASWPNVLVPYLWTAYIVLITAAIVVVLFSF